MAMYFVYLITGLLFGLVVLAIGGFSAGLNIWGGLVLLTSVALFTIAAPLQALGFRKLATLVALADAPWLLLPWLIVEFVKNDSLRTTIAISSVVGLSIAMASWFAMRSSEEQRLLTRTPPRRRSNGLYTIIDSVLRIAGAVLPWSILLAYVLLLTT
jgi:hypothetical protein